MKRNWFLPVLAVSAAMMFSACGDDSSTSSTPVVTPGTPSTPSTPTPDPGTTPTTPTTQTYGILPTTANPAASLTWYASWKGTYSKTFRANH